MFLLTIVRILTSVSLDARDHLRVHDLILTLKENLGIPVWIKMRVFDDLEKTIR
jgi:hypothetical protein